jgi:hypothetical protein
VKAKSLVNWLRVPKKSWNALPSPLLPVLQPHCGGNETSGTIDIQYWVPAAALKLTARA